MPDRLTSALSKASSLSAMKHPNLNSDWQRLIYEIPDVVACKDIGSVDEGIHKLSHPQRQAD